MPELPEVENTRAGIAAVIVGRTFAGACIRQPALRWSVPVDLDRRIRRQVVQAVRRRAKYLLIDTHVGSIILHLGMSGSLHLVASAQPPLVHDHLDLKFDDGLCLRLRDPRRFGAVLWAPDPASHPLLRRLGVEPLGDDFNPEALYAGARGRKRAIKCHLMDQRIVAGIGNIYAAEALFAAGIRPHRPAGRISLVRYGCLVDAVREILQAAIAAGGTTLRDYLNPRSEPGTFAQKLRVYARAGEPCVRCNQPIIKRMTGQRSTFYCARCQR